MRSLRLAWLALPLAGSIRLQPKSLSPSEKARLKLAAAAWEVRSRLRASLVEFEAGERRVALLEDQAALREELANRLERQFEAGISSALGQNKARLAQLEAQSKLQQSIGALDDNLQRPFEMPAAIFELGQTSHSE